MIPEALMDTDILSALMRKDAQALAQAKSYLAKHKRFSFSIITRYEILRGLKAKQATAQLAVFDQFCKANRILELTDEIIVKAAEIYSGLYQRGELIGDADILIAASALVHDLVVVTGNEKHFRRIPKLTVTNWFKSSENA